MNIHGFNKTTLLDYPEHVAATIFTGSCNFRCPFCHNASLVLSPDSVPKISETEVLSVLQKRKNVLTGVCITGGEPTLQSDLASFLSKIKEMGYLIKLDNNGYKTYVISFFLKEKLLDMIAMDVKSCLSKYPFVSGLPSLDTGKIKESIALIQASGIDHEFRTTVVKELHPIEDLITLSQELKGCNAYFLQPFQDSGTILNGSFSSYSLEDLHSILSLIQENVPNAKIRGDI